MPDYLVQEDGTKIILEDGSGFLILEESQPVQPDPSMGRMLLLNP